MPPPPSQWEFEKYQEPQSTDVEAETSRQWDNWAAAVEANLRNVVERVDTVSGTIQDLAEQVQQAADVQRAEAVQNAENWTQQANWGQEFQVQAQQLGNTVQIHMQQTAAQFQMCQAEIQHGRELTTMMRSQGHPTVEYKETDLQPLKLEVQTLRAVDAEMRRELEDAKAKIQHLQLSNARVLTDVQTLFVGLGQGIQVKWSSMKSELSSVKAENATLQKQVQALFGRMSLVEQTAALQQISPVVAPQNPQPPARPSSSASPAPTPQPVPETLKAADVAQIVRAELAVFSTVQSTVTAPQSRNPIGRVVQKATTAAGHSSPVDPLEMSSFPVMIGLAQPEVQVRVIETGAPETAGIMVPAPISVVPMATQAAFLNPVVMTLPLERPQKFSGNRRDWRKFSREFDKYDRDIRSLGAVTEAARIRALETLLDRAGQHKVATIQRDAESKKPAADIATGESGSGYHVRGPAGRCKAGAQGSCPRVGRWTSSGADMEGVRRRIPVPQRPGPRRH